MDIILKQDVTNLGSKDDIVTVKDGYARNFLIPNKVAVIASASAKKVLEENIRQRAHKEAKLVDEAQVIAGQLKDIKLTIGAKTSSKGKIFGSVSNIQIAEELTKKGFDLDRRKITIKEDIVKETGSYTATIKLHKEVIVDLPFDIIAE